MKRLFMMHFAIVLMLSAAFSVLAHHGWADFDRSRKVEVNGVIVESKYENPHCFVRVKVDQNDWAVELSALPRMKRQNITAQMIASGTRVTLIGHPHKNKARVMKAIQMSVNGKTYDLTQ